MILQSAVVKRAGPSGPHPQHQLKARCRLFVFGVIHGRGAFTLMPSPVSSAFLSKHEQREPLTDRFLRFVCVFRVRSRLCRSLAAGDHLVFIGVGFLACYL